MFKSKNETQFIAKKCIFVSQSDLSFENGIVCNINKKGILNEFKKSLLLKWASFGLFSSFLFNLQFNEAKGNIYYVCKWTV